MSAWTPGPWTYEYLPQHRGRVYAKDRTETICDVALWMVDYRENEANARLIAAAPELYSSLAEILDYISGADNALEDEYVVARAVAALAKARGEEA